MIFLFLLPGDNHRDLDPTAPSAKIIAMPKKSTNDILFAVIKEPVKNN
jgi:hypothetical protein